MITADEAKKELEWLAGLDYFPKVRGAVEALVTALCAADTVEIAHRAVLDWLGESRKAPTPGDLQ